jgi:hypothetical protein
MHSRTVRAHTSSPSALDWNATRSRLAFESHDSSSLKESPNVQVHEVSDQGVTVVPDTSGGYEGARWAPEGGSLDWVDIGGDSALAQSIGWSLWKFTTGPTGMEKPASRASPSGDTWRRATPGVTGVRPAGPPAPPLLGRLPPHRSCGGEELGRSLAGAAVDSRRRTAARIAEHSPLRAPAADRGRRAGCATRVSDRSPDLILLDVPLAGDTSSVDEVGSARRRRA